MCEQLPPLRVDERILIGRELVDEAARLIKYEATVCGYAGFLVGTVREGREQEVIAVCEGWRDRIEAEDLSVFDTMLPVMFEADAEAVEAVWPPAPLCATCGMACRGGRLCTLCSKWRAPLTKRLWQTVSV